jgi:hypothetical protein
MRWKVCGLSAKPWTIQSSVSRDAAFYNKAPDGGDALHKDSHIGSANVNWIRQSKTGCDCCTKPDRILTRMVEAKPRRRRRLSCLTSGGQTGVLLNSQRRLILRPFYYTSLGARSGQNAEGTCTPAPESFFKGPVDGGENRFSNFQHNPHGDNHDLWINQPGMPAR